MELFHNIEGSDVKESQLGGGTWGEGQRKRRAVHTADGVESGHVRRCAAAAEWSGTVAPRPFQHDHYSHKVSGAHTRAPFPANEQSKRPQNPFQKMGEHVDDDLGLLICVGTAFVCGGRCSQGM